MSLKLSAHAASQKNQGNFTNIKINIGEMNGWWIAVSCTKYSSQKKFYIVTRTVLQEHG